MSNPQNSKSFRESLVVKNYEYPKISNNSQKKTNGNTPGEKGGQGRTKGGYTR